MADYTPEEKAEIEKCVECGAEIPNIRTPKEISGSLLCKVCAEKLGLPTLIEQLGFRMKCDAYAVKGADQDG